MRIAVGVPMLVASLFAVLLAFRLTGRPLGGGVFWLVLLATVIGFSVYFLRPLLSLLRRG